MSNYYGTFIKILGKCKLKYSLITGIIKKIVFVILDKDDQLIMEFETLIKQNLIKKIQWIELQFKVVFKDIRDTKVDKCELKVLPGADGNVI